MTFDPNNPATWVPAPAPPPNPGGYAAIPTQGGHLVSPVAGPPTMAPAIPGVQLTAEQQAQAAALATTFAETAGAQLYGNSRNFEPGEGRLRFGAAKIQQGNKGQFFIAEAEIVWFRGGRALDQAAPNDASRAFQVPDDALAPGDAVAHFVDLAWASRGEHFKRFGLAVLQSRALAQGQDPKAIVADMITPEVVSQIVALQLQQGLECDFEAMHVSKRDSTGVFTKLIYYGDRKKEPRAMRAAAPPPAAPAANPLDGLGAPATAAPYIPPAAPGVPSPPTFPAQLAASFAAASAPLPPSPPSFPPPAAPLPGVPMAPGQGVPPAQALKDRNTMIAEIVARNPAMQAVDWTQVPDEALRQAYEGIAPPF